MVENQTALIAVEHGDAADFRALLDAGMKTCEHAAFHGTRARGSLDTSLATGDTVSWVVCADRGQKFGARLAAAIAEAGPTRVSLFSGSGEADAPKNRLQMTASATLTVFEVDAKGRAAPGTTSELAPVTHTSVKATTLPWSPGDLRMSLEGFVSQSLRDAAAAHFGVQQTSMGDQHATWRKQTSGLSRRLEHLVGLVREAASTAFEAQPDGRFLVRLALADGSRQLSFLTADEKASLETAVNTAA